MPSNVFSLRLKQTFPPIIWIFTEGKGDEFESRIPFKNFSTLMRIHLGFSFIVLLVNIHMHGTQRLHSAYRKRPKLPWSYSQWSQMLSELAFIYLIRHKNSSKKFVQKIRPKKFVQKIPTKHSYQKFLPKSNTPSGILINPLCCFCHFPLTWNIPFCFFRTEGWALKKTYDFFKFCGLLRISEI